jgi:hypothetical protein
MHLGLVRYAEGAFRCTHAPYGACDSFHKVAKKMFDSLLAARQINGLPLEQSLSRPLRTPAAREEPLLPGS